MAGLVFNMTDCPSEDDDEEHHPVYLPEGIVEVIVLSCTHGAEDMIPGFTRGDWHFSTASNKVPRQCTGDIKKMSPVFQNPCDYGLIGL